MICSRCGTANSAGRKFCLECGTSFAAACPSCGTANEPGAKFCGECGAVLGATASSATAFAAAAVDASVARPATPSTQAPTAERRLVSVLFADLVGFTALASDRDPEAVRELLGRYFETAREIVERYGGVVEKFIGDAVMAVWGTPVAHEDDAERAVRAALDLVTAVRALRLEPAGPELAARVGVLTGEAAVTLGAQGQGMVAGDLVNTASRLQSVAPPGTVLVGEATHRAASGAIVFEPAGEQLLKGKTSPVPAHRAVRVVAKRGGAGRSEALEAPFVGRDDELRLFKDLFHATAREKRLRLVSITGQAGIGKGRLAWEFLKYIDGLVDDVYWHQGRSPAYGEGITFWALGEMVRRRAGLAESDDEATTRSAISVALQEYVANEADRRWIEPALLALLGLEEPPGDGREDLFAAWRTFFEHVSAKGPAVMVFEDLHWADSGLLDFIDHLLDWSRNRPLCILTLARPELLERRPGWGAGRRNFVALGLEPLSPEAMRTLLAGLVPGLPEPVVRAILGRAEGIPLYAVETIRMLVAEGRLEAGEDGTYRPVGDLSDLAVPESLRGLIAARLDALEPADRSLLQDASVLGQTFTVESLAALTGQTREPLEPRLRALVRRELLLFDTDPRSPERGQYGFTQGLIREVAYGTLARRDRRARHLAAARHYETLEDGELAGVLASHYLDAYRAAPEGPEGEAVATQARIALRGAAERAAALGSHEQAVSYFEKALTVTTDPAEQAELLERAGHSASIAGRHDAAEEFLGRALDRQRELGDHVAVARAAAAFAHALLNGFRIERAIAILEETHAALADLGTEPAGVALAAELARAYNMHEDLPRAGAWAERTLADAERLGLVPIVADLLLTKGAALSQVGRTYEGMALVDGGRRLADARGLAITAIRARNLLLVGNLLVDPRRSIEIAREALEMSRRLGLRSWAAMVVGNAGEAAFRSGDWDWTLAELDDLLALDLELSDRVGLVGIGAMIRAARGDAGSAGEALDRMAAEVTQVLLLANVRLYQSFVALAEGRLNEAVEHGLAVADLSPINTATALTVAARASLWHGDVRRLRVVTDRLAGLGSLGAIVEVDRLTLGAGLAALEGRTAEAQAGYRDALGRWRDLDLPVERALCAIDLVTALGPDDPMATAAADEARGIFSGLGARPYLERLEAALSRSAARSAPGAPA